MYYVRSVRFASVASPLYCWTLAILEVISHLKGSAYFLVITIASNF